MVATMVKMNSSLYSSQDIACTQKDKESLRNLRSGLWSRERVLISRIFIKNSVINTLSRIKSNSRIVGNFSQ